MTFQEALEAQFRLRGNAARDVMPSLVRARYKRGPETDRGRRSLAVMMRNMDFRCGVEVGTFRGDSAKMWCKANPQVHLTCVDPYLAYSARRSQSRQDETYERAKKTLARFNVTFVRAKSMDAVRDVADGSLDFVYIDGDHSFDPVMQDLICWARKVRKGGLIMLHDYAVLWQGGVRHAVDAYTQCHLIHPWYITHDRLPTAFWQKGSERA